MTLRLLPLPRDPLPPAHVLWFGPTGLTVARALGRQGVPVVGWHHDPNEAAVCTRYADVRIVPPLAQAEDVWLSSLLDAAPQGAGPKPVLIPVSDATWLFVAKNRRTLGGRFTLLAPDGPDLTDWLTKTWQYQAADRAGVPYPRIIAPRDFSDLKRLASRLEFPCIIKPVMSHLWMQHYRRKAALVKAADDLLKIGGDALNRGLSFVVQEYVPAEDHEVYGLYCYLDRHSRPLGACVSRKVRQCEPRFGSSCMSASVYQPRVVELGGRMLQSIGYRGIGSVEFKRDPRDGEFKLMEINMRPPLLMAVACAAGVNLAYVAYRDLIGDPIPMQTPKRLGRRVGILQHDLHSARFYRSIDRLTRVRTILDWLRTRDVYFAWDDLRPAWRYAHMLIEHWRRGAFQRLPDTFPTLEEWKAGEWDGVRKSGDLKPSLNLQASDDDVSAAA